MKVAILVVGFALVAAAQSKEDLVGTWKLVSAWNVRPDGGRVSTYGDNAVGFLTYTAEGRMIAILGRGDRKLLSGNRATAPVAERAEAFSTMLAYTGPYTVLPGKVVHHVEASTYQNWVGSDQVRMMKLEGDRLTLSTQAASGGGFAELFWQRLR
jgi:hypothetical protein